MEFENNEYFNEYIEKYKNLSLEEKKENVEKEFQELLTVMDALCKRHGKNPKILYNREIEDLKKSYAPQDDFVEAMFVYVHSVKELFASLMDVLEK